MFLCINGGRKMNGELNIRSAKNSVLPIIACCILTKRTVVLRNCPPLLDILAMLEIIKSVGGSADFDGDSIVINCADVVPAKIESSLTQGIRSSVFILGPILSRLRSASVSYPGGCEIGERPIDLHLEGLRALGVKTVTEDGVIDCDGTEMRGGEIALPLPSVGATENIMMAAVLTSGQTVIRGAAREPEIVDLARFINMLGGRVLGAGSSVITIDGVIELGGGEFTPLSDRIVAGTYLAACAMTGGKVRLNNVAVENIYPIIDRLQAAGCRFGYKKDSVTITSDGQVRAVPKTSTMPHPGFPTDMQAQLVSVLSVANGQSIVEENLFESRFRYITQLKKMGADIEVRGKNAVISGVPTLRAARLEAQDLRGGAALVIAAMRAQGESALFGVNHIDRGYYKIENDLRTLNADIRRCT